MTLAVARQGSSVTTVEGLEREGQLSAIQEAFIRNDGFQCGFCTAGQLMVAHAYISEGGPADEEAIAEAMSGNLCRCGAYLGIRRALLEVLPTP